MQILIMLWTKAHVHLSTNLVSLVGSSYLYPNKIKFFHGT